VAKETTVAPVTKGNPNLTPPIIRFEHANGHFVKKDTTWIEHGNEVSYTYEFREIARDDKWIYVRDDSRRMNARFPLNGGTMYLHSDDCHPDIWYPHVTVKPFAADSAVPSVIVQNRAYDT
jgi:hypothetical protein